MDPITILASLLPILVEGGKAAINRWIAPDQLRPATVDDYAKLRQVDLEFFKAVSEAGGANPSYPWVEAAVRLMRPGIALIVLGVWGYLHATGQVETSTVDNMAAVIGFYLFGDRTLFYAKRAITK